MINLVSFGEQIELYWTSDSIQNNCTDVQEGMCCLQCVFCPRSALYNFTKLSSFEYLKHLVVAPQFISPVMGWCC